ncbi:hypothetical protein CHS0354_003174 [Potamilus streckersoni]|uniref:Uncharacterized protein n=1 Tax=Potamilus streckersoni TaxID=2493646 RepID=A0AAE0WCH9_9BIVA|nr:hypothetical protein CHS0354_003174 [Potamilus streckersoni]
MGLMYIFACGPTVAFSSLTDQQQSISFKVLQFCEVLSNSILPQLFNCGNPRVLFPSYNCTDINFCTTSSSSLSATSLIFFTPKPALCSISFSVAVGMYLLSLFAKHTN